MPPPSSRCPSPAAPGGGPWASHSWTRSLLPRLSPLPLPLLLLLLLPPATQAAEPTPPAPPVSASPLRLGFSGALFSGMNENDAKAAVKGWGGTIARERDVPVTPEPRVFTTSSALVAALRAREIDIVGIQTTEFASLAGSVPLDPVFVTQNAGRLRERYVLLVRKDRGITRLADLQGRNLLVFHSARMCLALPWLELTLADAGLGRISDLVAQNQDTPKLTRAVLPVFFGQADACLVLRNGFETMCELNPQLRSQLQVLAESRELVPIVMAFRGDYRPPFHDRLVEGLQEMHVTPAGQQVLTIFQSERLVKEPGDCLQPALDLLRHHAALPTSAKPAAPAAPPN